MRTNYIDPVTRSIISLTPPSEFCPEWTINRVSVLPPHRGSGLARKLMSELLFDADVEGVVLQLVVAPDGSLTGLDVTDLEKWYSRCGFEVVDPEYTLMKRQPQKRTSLAQVSNIRMGRNPEQDQHQLPMAMPRAWSGRKIRFQKASE